MRRRHRFVRLDDANPHFFSRGVSAWVEEAEDSLWADIILFLILNCPSCEELWVVDIILPLLWPLQPCQAVYVCVCMYVYVHTHICVKEQPARFGSPTTSS